MSVLALVLAAMPVAKAQTEDIAPAPPSETNVVYGQGGTANGPMALLLDIYQPDEACTAPRPFVIAIHGGGYRSGSKSREDWQTVGNELAARGIAALSIDYRLVGDEPIPSAGYEALVPLLREPWIRLAGQDDPAILETIASSVQDTMTAVRWARDNAEAQCLDPERVALWGASAGSFTAIIAAYGLDEIGLEGPAPTTVIDYWGGEFLAGSIGEGDAPLMIVHASTDTTIPYRYALELQANAQAAEVPSAFYTIKGANHGWKNMNVYNTYVGESSIFDLTLDFVVAELTGADPDYVTVRVEDGAGPTP